MRSRAMSSQRCRCASSGKSSLHLGVGPVDVLGIARERDPAERPLALAEERADVRRHEAGEGEGVVDALVLRDLADVVAVVDGGHARALEREHRAHVARRSTARAAASTAVRVGLLRAPPTARPSSPRQVAVARGRAREVWSVTRSGRTPRRTISGTTSAALPSSPTETGVCRARASIAPAPRRGRAPAGRGSGAQAHVDARLAAFDREHRGARHRRRQRLRAAHAAQARGQDPAAAWPRSPREVLPHRLGERLVGPLHDALRADVDPRARGHLAVHHQALAVELVEVVPGGPLRHQVRVGDQHARRVGMGPEDRDRLARLDQQRLVVAQALAASRGSRRSIPSCAPRGRCRRRPRARRGSRRPPGRGCSGSSGRRASVSQLRQASCVPRGARMTREASPSAMGHGIRHVGSIRYYTAHECFLSEPSDSSSRCLPCRPSAPRSCGDDQVRLSIDASRSAQGDTVSFVYRDYRAPQGDYKTVVYRSLATKALSAARRARW